MCVGFLGVKVGGMLLLYVDEKLGLERGAKLDGHARVER